MCICVVGSCPSGELSWWRVVGGGGGGSCPGEESSGGVCPGGSCPVGSCPRTDYLSLTVEHHTENMPCSWLLTLQFMSRPENHLFCTQKARNTVNSAQVKSIEPEEKKFKRKLDLKLPGRGGSWMGDYATCGSCHLAHAARFLFAPAL